MVRFSDTVSVIDTATNTVTATVPVGDGPRAFGQFIRAGNRQFTLSVTKTGTSNGTVTSSLPGIDCGADCGETYFSGTGVTLTATAAVGPNFAGWSGACSGTGTCTLTMDATKSVTATFALQSFALTVLKAGAGSGTVTSSPAGIDCGGDCTEGYSHGTAVTLTASPANNSTFAGWDGDPDCVDARVIMTADKTCTGHFIRVDGPLFMLSKAGTGSGRVTSNPPGIDCGVDCVQSFPRDTVVSLMATPDADSAFVGWSGDADCGDGQVTMRTDKTCTATFTKQYTLTMAKAGDGSGRVTSSPAGIDCGADCSERYASGTEVSLIVTPETDSMFERWDGDADCAGGRVLMTADRTCTAHFLHVEGPILTVSRAGAGSGRVMSSPPGIDCGLDCMESVQRGTVMTLTATPDVGSVFSGWSGDPDCVDGRVTMRTDKTCTATFIEQFTLSVAVMGRGTVISTPAGIDCPDDCLEDYASGPMVTLTPVPASGWRFTGWDGACRGIGAWAVTMTTDQSVRATFKRSRR